MIQLDALTVLTRGITLKILSREQDRAMEISEILKIHKEQYGEFPQLISRAPGTTRLFGEFAESIEGKTLAIGLSWGIEIAISERSDFSLRFFQQQTKEKRRASLSSLKHKREDRWVNMFKSVINAFILRGYSLKGMNVSIFDEIPVGFYLYSNVAMVHSFALAVVRLFNLEVDDLYFFDSVCKGVLENSPDDRVVDISNSVILSSCQSSMVTQIDTRDFSSTQLPISEEAVRFFFIDTNIPKSTLDIDVDANYSARQEADIMAKKITSLMQVKTIQELPERDIAKSALKVTASQEARRYFEFLLSEEKRITSFQEALEKTDMRAAGSLLVKSHYDLRNLIEATYPEQDWIVKRATETPGILGARRAGDLPGRGVLLASSSGSIDNFAEQYQTEYEKIFGFSFDVYQVNTAGKAAVIYDATRS